VEFTIIKKGYRVIVTTNLAHKSRRRIKKNPVNKIRGKKVRVVGLTSHTRLTLRPPKGAPEAIQKLFTLALKTKLSSDIQKTTWTPASM
jgi:hypothetical protein